MGVYMYPVKIGSPVVSGTSGSVLFVDSNGNLAQNNANFFWDNTNSRLGIGNVSPSASLDIVKNQNTFTYINVTNTSGGASAQTFIGLLSDGASQLQFSNYGSGYTGTRWGVTLASYSEVLGSVSGLGMAVGTFGATQLILGTNSLARMTILSGGNVGIGTTSPNTTLHVNGGFSVGVVSKSANYTMLTSDYAVLGTSGALGITITLPAASNKGMIVTIIKIDTGPGALTVSRAGADTIEGANTLSLSLQYKKSVLVADGASTWYDLGSGLV